MLGGGGSGGYSDAYTQESEKNPGRNRSMTQNLYLRLAFAI